MRRIRDYHAPPGFDGAARQCIICGSRGDLAGRRVGGRAESPPDECRGAGASSLRGRARGGGGGGGCCPGSAHGEPGPGGGRRPQEELRAPLLGRQRPVRAHQLLGRPRPVLSAARPELLAGLRRVELRAGGFPAPAVDGRLAERVGPHALAAGHGPGRHPLHGHAVRAAPAPPARVRSQRRALRAAQQPAGPAGAREGVRAGPPAAGGGRGPQLLPDRAAASAPRGVAPEPQAQREPAQGLRSAAGGGAGEQARRLPRRAAGLAGPGRHGPLAGRARDRPRAVPRTFGPLADGAARAGGRGPARGARRRRGAAGGSSRPGAVPPARAAGGPRPDRRRAAVGVPRPAEPASPARPEPRLHPGRARHHLQQRLHLRPPRRRVLERLVSGRALQRAGEPGGGRDRGRGAHAGRAPAGAAGGGGGAGGAARAGAHPQERGPAEERGAGGRAAAAPGHPPLPARPRLQLRRGRCRGQPGARPQRPREPAHELPGRPHRADARHRRPRRRHGVQVSTFPGVLGGERFARVLLQARLRAVGAARSMAAEARSWLRRDAWTRENLRSAAAAARRRPRRLAVAVTALAAAAVLPALLLTGGDPPGVSTAEVQGGAFRVSIVEAGTLQALRSVTYASAIQSNQAKIVALAPEGKLVQKGDLLILFDAAPFEEEIRRSQAQLAQAQADLAKAREDLKLQVIQNQEDLATARQKVERSALELKDVQEGKGKLREEEAAAAVANAERELQKAIGALEDLRPLLSEGFITKQELERAEQAVARARDDLTLAQRRRDSLVQFGRPLELSQARSDATLTKESLRQLESAAAYRLQQKQAAIAGADSRIQESASKLTQAQQQLARTEVRADVSGIVVYRDR